PRRRAGDRSRVHPSNDPAGALPTPITGAVARDAGTGPSLASRIMVTTARRDLLLFFAGTFGLSWALWGAALLAGGDVAQPLPQVLFVLGAFGPTAVALLFWCCGRRRPRGANPLRSAARWLPAALLLGAAPALAAALVDGTLDPAVAAG